MEKLFERSIYLSRWLLAPVFLGLSVALIALGVKFFIEIGHLVTQVVTMSETDFVLIILGLVDLALVGSLLVMVMFSGYENFVSKLDIAEDGDRPDWLGKLDSNTLKLKVASSIVAISSIHLLRAFMNAEKTDDDKLMWYVIIHMSFVLSALLMAVMERVLHNGKHEH